MWSVLFLTLTYGELPWVALTLAGTFSLYGLLRKTAPLGSLEGLTMETLLLFPVATGFLIWIETQGRGAFLHVGPKESWLLGLAGLATAIPLLLFAAGARRLTMTTLGMLQYIAPSLQFTLGVLLYGEALSPAKLTGFVLIWVALLVYTLESVWAGRQRKGEATARPTGPE